MSQAQTNLEQLFQATKAAGKATPDQLEAIRRQIIERLIGPPPPQPRSWLEWLAWHFNLSTAALATLGLLVLALFTGGMLLASQDRPLLRSAQALAPLDKGPMGSNPLGWPHPQTTSAQKPLAHTEAAAPSTEPIMSFETGSPIESLPAVQPVSYNGAPRPK
jgi:hypothetical protein